MARALPQWKNETEKEYEGLGREAGSQRLGCRFLKVAATTRIMNSSTTVGEGKGKGKASNKQRYIHVKHTEKYMKSGDLMQNRIY